MLTEILGKAGVRYLPLLYQTLTYEDTFYSALAQTQESAENAN